MRRVTLRERGRLRRLRSGRVPAPDTLDECWVESRIFDRLMTYDRDREDGSVFDWRVDEGRAGQWVGVVQVPGLLLELLPKIDEVPEQSGCADNPEKLTLARDNLLVMLVEAGAVPLRFRDLADLGSRRAPLHETLIVLFAQRLRTELLRGPERGYITHEDDLRVLRGKLLIGRHIARNAARRERFTCAYDEFTTDTTLNRVLKATCRVLLGGVRSRRGREALTQCLLMLDDVTDVFDARPLLERVVMTRQNARFADLFIFSELVLLQLAPTAAAGKNTVFSLLFDMDRIFEDFIASMAHRAARQLNNGTRVFPQGRGKHRYLLKGQQGDILRMQPDLLVEGPHRLIIDTKWKRLGPSTRQSRGRPKGLSAGDLYQLHAYTHRYGVTRSVLLYPHAPGVSEREFEPLDADGKPVGSEIAVRFVKLQRNLRRKSEFDALVGELAEVMGGAPRHTVQTVFPAR